MKTQTEGVNEEWWRRKLKETEGEQNRLLCTVFSNLKNIFKSSAIVHFKWKTTSLVLKKVEEELLFFLVCLFVSKVTSVSLDRNLLLHSVRKDCSLVSSVLLPTSSLTGILANKWTLRTAGDKISLFFALSVANSQTWVPSTFQLTVSCLRPDPKLFFSLCCEKSCCPFCRSLFDSFSGIHETCLLSVF